jgi:hypothetical protein
MRRVGGILALVLAACRPATTSSKPGVGIGRGEVAESTLAWPVPDPETSTQVEVRNAAGVTGLARIVTHRLRAGGFDVVTFGSHDAGSDTTLVLARRGTPDRAQRVRDVLGQGMVREQRDTTRRVDVTVILGRDFKVTP